MVPALRCSEVGLGGRQAQRSTGFGRVDDPLVIQSDGIRAEEENRIGWLCPEEASPCDDYRSKRWQGSGEWERIVSLWDGV